ncbi:MAG: HAD family phosphatase [Clostridia bacterium]|nr:HAD family phosphatase [Clostridia bacterium]
MIQGVIFDADGTLLDSMPYWDRSVLGIVRSFGLVPEKGLTEILTPMSMEEGAQYLIDRYKLTASVEEIVAEENRRAEEFYETKVGLKNGVLPLLHMLAENGVRLSVATATDKYLIDKALKATGIISYFDAVLSCGDIGEGKSSPTIFFKACEIMKTQPQHTVVVDDSLTAITTAKNNGFKTAAVYDDMQKKHWAQLCRLGDMLIENDFDKDIFKELFV